MSSAARALFWHSPNSAHLAQLSWLSSQPNDSFNSVWKRHSRQLFGHCIAVAFMEAWHSPRLARSSHPYPGVSSQPLLMFKLESSRPGCFGLELDSRAVFDLQILQLCRQVFSMKARLWRHSPSAAPAAQPASESLHSSSDSPPLRKKLPRPARLPNCRRRLTGSVDVRALLKDYGHCRKPKLRD